MKTFIAYLILLTVTVNLNAQMLSADIGQDYYLTSSSVTDNPLKEYVFKNVLTPRTELIKEIDQVNKSDIRNHYLGDNIAKRIYLIEKYYTRISEPAPGEFEGQKVITKPAIYTSVYKIEKYYRKQVRKGLIEDSIGADELSYYLDLALILYSENTDDFQKGVEKAKDPRDIIAVYNSVEIR